MARRSTDAGLPQSLTAESVRGAGEPVVVTPQGPTSRLQNPGGRGHGAHPPRRERRQLEAGELVEVAITVTNTARGPPRRSSSTTRSQTGQPTSIEVDGIDAWRDVYQHVVPLHGAGRRPPRGVRQPQGHSTPRRSPRGRCSPIMRRAGRSSRSRRTRGAARAADIRVPGRRCSPRPTANGDLYFGRPKDTPVTVPDAHGSDSPTPLTRDVRP